jgi:hypothetical protein
LPHEHGAYLTLGGASAAGLLIAPSWAGVGLALAVAAAFFARAPLEALHRPARFDRAALSGYAAVAALGVALGGLAAALIAGAVIALSWAGRLTRHHRHALFELCGMAVLGALGGGIAEVGGAQPLTAAALAVVLGSHAATAVPLVRTELRPAERKDSGRADQWAAILLLVAATGLVALGRPSSALVLLPRAIHVAARRLRALPRMRPSLVGLRESLLLAVTIALCVLVFR